MDLTLYQLDAFTRHPFEGNPCAVVLDADGLDAQAMQRIAQEMNLSETAFVLRSQVADVRARYFTPAEEIPLAGHPTLATMKALLHSGALRPQVGEMTVTLELQAGVIEVSIRDASYDAPLITMSQMRPAFLRRYAAGDVLPVFGLDEGDLLPGAPIQTVSTGTPQLMVPLGTLEALRRVRVDVAAYQRLREQGDFFSPHLFVPTGLTPAGATFARHFGVPPDTLEDPFTGSATGGMAAYLWHHGLIGSPRFVAEQGHWMGRPGEARVEVVGPRDAIETVRVGGHAVLVLEGKIRRPPTAEDG